MSYWGEHSVHTVYCDINWLAKQIKITKINNNFFFKNYFEGTLMSHVIFFFKNHVFLGGTLSPHSVL